MKIIKKPGQINATVVGNPTISNDFIVSNFSGNNYLLLPEVFNPSTYSWEWVMKAKNNEPPAISGQDSMVLIASGKNADYQGLIIEIRGAPTKNTVRLLVSGNGTSWNIAGTDSTFQIPIGVWYYLKTKFTGTQYIVSYSTDGITYQDIITVNSSSKMFVSSSPLAIGDHRKYPTTTYYMGEIDMKECWYKINDVLVWTGTKDYYYNIKRNNKYYGISSSQYQQLEYIQSTDGQYIDTLFVPNQDTKIEITFEMSELSHNSFVFGSAYGWEQNMYGLYFAVASSERSLSYVYGSGGSGASRKQWRSFAFDTKYKSVTDKNNWQVFQNNSVIHSDSFTTRTFASPKNLLLFANQYYLYGGELGEYAKMKLYDCKIYDNTTLVRDYIPVRRQNDNVVCLFDQITQQYFENLGTGSFIGSDE